MILHGIIGNAENLASTKQNAMANIIDPIKHPTTTGSDHGLILPPRVVASKNNTTADTMVKAPA